nr:MAG TPA: hypothetical protein [Caudoviricetes sp.]
MGRFEHPIKVSPFCAISKVNYSLYFTYRTFYHVHLSKVKSTPLRISIFARLSGLSLLILQLPVFPYLNETYPAYVIVLCGNTYFMLSVRWKMCL